ncbi:ABC transporter permease [Candidatus Desulfofervidus auxilii]|uniref:ABC transporter permease n=1 Tax=Desulfofervidus auxilii TaxID=1621989 RepID=A0A7U4THB1_DESA2|nr:ABC transporter permease subunit [Candidatus Desulfofervidus auxilii]CAD7769918.1 MAG: ABC-2 family transporter protein [Candidatus Methanoperedenaceae archaeon GB50]CAD7775056.1 ABC-2 family transporter protein [Candidatus Methanoperedenaceae archaeon GB37]AMM40644.1 ABC transporter permease [Candidatus Desulfofervidus auxilii]MDL1965995.1 ABC transporter permease [Candidatus Desulfofervidus auxilii]CAD7773690.1 ABC-2 family transporter protein [Candidatus Methanoperedenaceae archaeon GB50
MRNIWVILKRELYSYFASPIVYTILFIFLLLSGYFFYSNVAYFSLMSIQAGQWMGGDFTLGEWVIEPLLGNMSVVVLLLLPLLTMRLFAEEKRQGNLELLLSYPVRDIELALGKFLGCMSVYALMLFFTLVYPLLLAWLGRSDLGTFFSGYLGLFLMGSAFIAFGLFISTLTENQVVAAALTFGLLLFFWIIGWAAYITEPPISKIFENISLITHFRHFTKGIIDTADIFFYLSFIIFGIFLTLNALRAQYRRD